MTQIILEKINPQVIAKLTDMAKENKRTLEEEITSILENVINESVTNSQKRKWSPNFFKLTCGSWQGEPLERETQPEYQEREELL